MKDLEAFNPFFRRGLKITRINEAFFQLRHHGKLIGYLEKEQVHGSHVRYIIQATTQTGSKTIPFRSLREFYNAVQNLENILFKNTPRYI